VPRVSRSCEHFPDGLDLHLLRWGCTYVKFKVKNCPVFQISETRFADWLLLCQDESQDDEVATKFKQIMAARGGEIEKLKVERTHLKTNNTGLVTIIDELRAEKLAMVEAVRQHAGCVATIEKMRSELAAERQTVAAKQQEINALKANLTTQLAAAKQEGKNKQKVNPIFANPQPLPFDPKH